MRHRIEHRTTPLRVNPKRIKSVRVEVYLTRETGTWWNRRLCTLFCVPGQIGIGRSDWGWVTIFYSAEQYNELIQRLQQAGRKDALEHMRVVSYPRWHYIFNNMFDSKGERL